MPRSLSQPLVYFLQNDRGTLSSITLISFLLLVVSLPGMKVL